MIRESKLLFRSVGVLFVALTVTIILVAFVGTNALNSAKSAANKADVAAVAAKLQVLHGCERGNVINAKDNRSQYADYQVFSFIVARFLVPTKTETPAQKQITDEFETKLRASVAAKAWTPLTNCLAVASNYRAPQSVAFTKGTPPASALSVQNASLLSPVGSVS